MRTKIIFGKNGQKMGTRLPRNIDDWRADFNKMISVKNTGYKTNCWLWGKTEIKQYGATNLDGIPIRPNRLSWVLHNGTIPIGLWVLHKCDVRRCVNPDHLFLGTAKDNTTDMISKSRQRHLRGEDCPASKITEGDVRKIRFLAKTTSKPYWEIAKDFNISCSAARSIATFRTWKHVNGRPVLRPLEKLDMGRVSQIKEFLNTSLTQKEIADKFGVHQSVISRIKNNHTWGLSKHV